jgi:hypothetical protein
MLQKLTNCSALPNTKNWLVHKSLFKRSGYTKAQNSKFGMIFELSIQRDGSALGTPARNASLHLFI